MGIKTEEINIKYASKTAFANLFMPDTSGAHPAVIMSHGFNSSYGEWTNECVWFSQHGYTALAIDFCGGSLVSRSSGSTREMTVTSETEDLLASLDYIRALPDIDKENTFLLGASQGGFVSALAAARRPQQVRSLALYYPALCIPDDWSARFPDPSAVPETFDLWGVELGRAYADDVRGLDPFAAISLYEGDVLILHGDKDPVVRYDYSQRAVSAYKNARLIKMEGEAHGFSPDASRRAMLAVFDFFQAHLK